MCVFSLARCIKFWAAAWAARASARASAPRRRGRGRARRRRPRRAARARACAALVHAAPAGGHVRAVRVSARSVRASGEAAAARRLRAREGCTRGPMLTAGWHLSQAQISNHKAIKVCLLRRADLRPFGAEARHKMCNPRAALAPPAPGAPQADWRDAGGRPERRGAPARRRWGKTRRGGEPAEARRRARRGWARARLQ